MINLGDGILSKNSRWSFGGDVCEKFNTHIKRSIPFYEEGHKLVCILSEFFVKPGSVCYELGTSTGELINKLADYNKNKQQVKWVGLDLEEEMIKFAEKNKTAKNIDFILEDISLFPYEKTDFVVAYYVIQFVPPRIRQQIFDKIYEVLNWGGAFVLFEKVRGPDARFQDIITELYTDFKLEQQYSPEEVISKRRSLKGVLEPFSTQGNIDLMHRAGFKDIFTAMKYLCFEGFLAIK